jgi:phosphatidylglycerol:prolipoprotein diacylglycerol transferase
MNRIAFPGLGLEFNINETAFTIFGIEIQWYGIILSTGIVAAFLLFSYLATKKEGIDLDSVYNLTLIVVPIAIIGARFVYVATNWDDYSGTGIINIINIRNGGIAIYGAILFGLATVIIFNKICKIKSLSMLDALAPAVMLGQIIGRWGNFVNAEAYGWSEGVENLPWRMELDYVRVDGQWVNAFKPHTACVHPTFLYESLWNLLGLAIILFILYRKKKFDGEIFFAYMGWYGLGRAFIEMIRADSLYLVGDLKFSVFVGFCCFIAAVIGEVLLYFRHKDEALELSEYKSQFDALKIKLEPHISNEATEVIEETEEAFDEIGDDDEEVLREQDLLDGDIEDSQEEKETEE